MNLRRQFWEPHFLRNEALLGLSIAVATFLAESLLGRASLNQLLQGDRSALWASLGVIAGSLLGFVLAAAAILVAVVNSDALRRIRSSSRFPEVWDVFLSATKWLGVLTLSALAMLVIDHKAEVSRPGLYIEIWLTAVSIFRLLRCIWVLDIALKLVSADAKTEQSR